MKRAGRELLGAFSDLGAALSSWCNAHPVIALLTIAVDAGVIAAGVYLTGVHS
jgi:hypothetical protein